MTRADQLPLALEKIQCCWSRCGISVHSYGGRSMKPRDLYRDWAAVIPSPWSRRRQTREVDCGGHQLWAAAGAIYEQAITVDGTTRYTEVTRHQTKRDCARRKDGTTRYQF
jgi:hypothetical protein